MLNFNIYRILQNVFLRLNLKVLGRSDVLNVTNKMKTQNFSFYSMEDIFTCRVSSTEFMLKKVSICINKKETGIIDLVIRTSK